MNKLSYTLTTVLLLALLSAAGCGRHQSAAALAPGVPAPAPGGSLLAQGKQAFRAGQYAQAEAAFAQLRKQHPDQQGAESWLGQCEIQEKKYDQAAADFLDLTKRAPQSATAWLGLGQAYEGLQRGADAGPCYQHALALDPRSEPARQGFLRTGNPKKIAVTIDDGPSLFYTEKAINESQRYGGRVTFFCEGVYCSRDAQIIRMMQANGEQIGNHSWDHPMLTRLSPDQVRYQLGHTNDVIVAQGGTRPSFFRPPFGDHNAMVDQIAHDLGMKVVLWDIDTEDWKISNPPARTVEYIRTHARPNSTILIHQVHNTFTVLDQIFKLLHDQGYTCVRLDELGRYPTKMG
jgi:peptidoglycan/xylan/chitin deacetylase (PgdA/CDA1 family)